MLMFECIQERDIDLLLMEEWCVNAGFAKFLLKQLVPGDPDVADRTAMHSVTDAEYGENDVVLAFRSSERRIAILVEDKIDAEAQDNQAKRYQIRAQKMKSEAQYDEVLICIVAPQHYLEKDTEEYPHRISYETLADFLSDGTPRGEYKANMLRLGISQERRHPQPVKNDRVTAFWQEYYRALKAEIPDAIMPYPKVVPAKSDWPVIRFPEFSSKVHIVHKMAQGHLDWESGLPEAELREIRIYGNTEGLKVVQTGKSFVLRLSVPPLDRMEDFVVQINKIREAFSKMRLLRDAITKYDGYGK